MSYNIKDFEQIRIHKENGNIENFDINRIKQAILKASSRTQHYLEEDEVEEILQIVYQQLDVPDKEYLLLFSDKIHDVVENSLLRKYPDIAFEYKQFRSYKRELNKEIQQKESEFENISKKNRFQSQFDKEFVEKFISKLIAKHPDESYYSLSLRIMNDLYKEQNQSKIKTYLMDKNNLNKLFNLLYDKMK